MKGTESRLIEFMDGSKKRFIIPVYQRNYDWKIENCKQLFDDLVKVVKANRKNHFFGSIVSVHETSGKTTKKLIIDGQQRLTTVSLLLLAMHNLVVEGVVIPEDAYLAKQIYEDFLVDKYEPQETRMKLKPIKNDQDAFSKLFLDKSEHVKESNLTTNYDYFYERIQRKEITIDELFDAIFKLIIIDIELDESDNPQLVFESLNSTGLDLSEGDKIRNFILMGLSTDEQSTYYEKYWNKIELCTSYDVSTFIRDYLSIKTGSIPPQKRVYIIFKEYVENESMTNSDWNIEILLQEIFEYAKRYEVLINGLTGNRVLNACIYRLNRLETSVTRPFFLEIMRLLDEGILDSQQVTDIFLTTENYIFRRTICDLPTNALNKVFLSLHKEIIRFDSTTEDYVKKFKYALLSKKERTRFPSDDEFAREFGDKQVYQMNSKNKIYILERLENFGTLEDKDVYRHCDEGDYTIEHIMPQHLTPIWVKELGDDNKLIHETWLHRIANLTLTAYNSQYSNSTFEEKKTMKNGFADSGIRMNTYIAQKQKWTLRELEERNQFLVSRALEIWSLPITDFKPVEKQLDYCTLEDEYNVNKRLLASFTFKEINYPVKTWTEMFVSILKMLYQEDKEILLKLATSNEDKIIGSYFSFKSDGFRSPKEIAANLFVENNSVSQEKLDIFRRLFKLYGIQLTDLVLYLQKDMRLSEAEVGAQNEVRKEYWAFALDEMKTVNADNEIFKNAKPTMDTWLSGFFKMSGFSITCLVGVDSSRVGLYLENGITDKNKKVFDYLLQNKEAIETSLGVTLDWQRGDGIKRSKISYQINDLGVNNKDNWPQMAEFHAVWSKKFYDVFYPYLKKLELPT